jgi:hypothetical protein
MYAKGEWLTQEKMYPKCLPRAGGIHGQSPIAQLLAVTANALLASPEEG